MGYGRGFATAFVGLASLARGQQFAFTHRMLPADVDPTEAVALGDLDGDGDLDAFVGNWDGSPDWRSRLYLNRGAGAFADVTAANLPAPYDPAMAVELGDVDGDGDLDAFLGAGWDPKRLYLNDGTAVFADVTATNLPALLDDTRAFALGDVDGDGDLDAFVGAYSTQDRLYINGGTGVFSDLTATNLPALLDYSFSVALGDLDGDGDLDAFVGNAYPQDCVLLNNGVGGFTDATATNLPAVLDNTLSVALGDVDGDGDLDALLGNWMLADRLYLNGGTGVFADATVPNFPSPADITEDVALEDVDGDGDLDAFVGNSWAPNRLCLNGGTGVFTDAPATSLPALLDPTYAVALGDVDGDGDFDALLGNRGPDRLYLNGGPGAFTEVTATNVPALSDETSAVALGDVDGDGDLDAFLGSMGIPPNGKSRLFLNGGTGDLTEVTATNLPALDDPARAVALGDVDGDGDIDVYVGNAGQPDRLYLNGGTGVFADVAATNLPAPIDGAGAVEFGDVDGDGDLDALVGNGGQPDRLYLNGGTGIFTDATATNLPALTNVSRAVALGDVDGDGDLDAVVGNAYSQDYLWLNGGTGVFTDVSATNLPAPFYGTAAVALGDVDGDGDLDAWFGTPAQARLYLNGGTGVFADVTATNLPTLFDDTRAVALGDVDGDGDLDALLGNQGGCPFPNPCTPGQNCLLLNGGTGIFTDVTATGLPALIVWTNAVELGDLDGDGDLDAFVGITGQSLLYTNLSRQLAWRGLPRVGKPLTLDLYGPANGFWVLAASLGSASLPLPPFGTLRLDPATLFVVGAGILDPQGRASLPFLVPSSPVLVGLSAYWQAGVGPPPLLTNLEITTATSL